MSNKYGPRIVTDGLVLCLDAADRNSYPGSGTSWYDLSGKSHHGTLSNVSFVSADPSFDFDVTNSDRITVANHADFNYGFADWSYSIWLYYQSTESVYWNQLFVKGDGSSYRRPGVWFYVNDPQKLHITWRDAASGQQSISKTDFSVPVAAWSNIVIQARGGVMTSYLNGVKDTQSVGISERDTSSNPLYIGNINGSYRSPNMKVAHFSVRNTSLTDDQILQNYNALKGRFGL